MEPWDKFRYCQTCNGFGYKRVKSKKIRKKLAGLERKRQYRTYLQQTGTTATASLNEESAEDRHEMIIQNESSLAQICKNCSGKGILPRINSTITTTKEVVDMKPVIIVGAGIGGISLAIALYQRGIPVEIYEKDSNFWERNQGYGLTMQQGANTLQKLGVMVRGVTSTSHFSFRPDGEVIGCYGFALLEDQRQALIEQKNQEKNARVNIHLPRQRLRASLLRHLPPSIIHWGCEFDHYEETSHDIQVFCRSRDLFVKVSGSILVGADGIFSGVKRQKLFGVQEIRNKTAGLRFLGVMVILGRAPCSHPLVKDGNRVTQTLDGITRIYTMPFTTPTDVTGREDDILWTIDLS